MHHRPVSPTTIEELPVRFTAAISPPGGSSPALPVVRLPDALVQPSTSSNAGVSVDKAGGNAIVHDRKGKGRASDTGDLALTDSHNQDYPIDYEGSRESSASSSAVGVPYRPHHPQNEPNDTGFGIKGPPGGDCKRICLRHQRMVDGGARGEMQKRLDKLRPAEQQTANAIWSLFSSSSGAARILTLRGLLTICCPSQLSFLSEQLKAECRLDPFAVLPRELSLKCMAYLDAMSLGRAAQVSKSWKALADDDLLWRTMCEQHIEKKCEKCGWGLPLLERKRKRKDPSTSAKSSALQVQQQQRFNAAHHNHTPLPKELEDVLGSLGNNDASMSDSSSNAGDNTEPSISVKRPRRNPVALTSASVLQFNDLSILSAPPSPTSSQGSSTLSLPRPRPEQQLTRPWKSIYCERLAIARNWARGKCSFRVLSGHTDAVTCLQIDETLTQPNYPVLMTGSWDRTVRVWNAESGECVQVLRGHTRGVRCIQFDSVKLITGSMDSTIKIWSWLTGECSRTLEGHRDAVVCLNFDKQILASGSADSTIKIWDFTTAECFTLRGHREWVNQVKIWSPGVDDCSAPPQPMTVPPTAGQSTDAVGQDALPKPDIKLLFSASDDGTVKVWDLYTRQCIRTLEGHVAQVQCLKVLSIDGPIKPPFPVPSQSGSQDSDKDQYIDSANGSISRRGQHHPNQVVAGNGYAGFFELQQQQQHIEASASTSTGVALSTFNNAFVPASQLAQAPPSSQAFLAGAARPPADPFGSLPIDFGGAAAPAVISGSLDNTIKIWNVEEGTCNRTLFGHIEGVWAVDMDKLRIVSASHDRTIKIWDRASGRCLHTLVGHQGAVTSVALGDDKIISGSDDSSVRIWSFAP